MLDKCKSYETNDLIMGSLERAIPALTKNESSQNIANSIWTNALGKLSTLYPSLFELVFAVASFIFFRTYLKQQLACSSIQLFDKNVSKSCIVS